ncbi:MAG: hypothetical protein IPN36_16830 [Bacteroidetes bacterium]|nr:hypothetical protein [Bacteroidota bacterium]
MIKPTMRELYQKLTRVLERGDTKIQIELNINRSKVKVTYTRNVESSISENNLVRAEQYLKTINIYRHGKKSGMQIITSEEFEFNSTKGDPADHPKSNRSIGFSSYDTTR